MPAETVKIGGHYYRVAEWDKARPGLPVKPSVDKAVWRKHNIHDDIIETTEPLADAVTLDIDKEGIPANGIGNWTVADFKGIQRDEEAYKPFKLNAHLVKNHCVGVLTHDEFQALKFYTEAKKNSVKLSEFQAAADLKAIAQVMPWGEAFRKGAPVVGLDGVLLTPAKLAEKWQSIIPAPVPKCLEKCVEVGYDVAIEERTVPLKSVEETVDLYAESRGKKVPGWSPTNAYVGAVKDSQSTVSTPINWQSNAEKHAMVFTAGSNYTIASGTIDMLKVGAPTGEVTLRLYAGDPSGAQVTLASGTISLDEMWVSDVFQWFGLVGGALTAGSVYTLELTTTAALSVTNYIRLGSNAAGGASGNQRWLYTGGAWAAQGASRLGFGTSDITDGGTVLVRADDNISNFATIKGAAVHTSDTYTVYMGATLTRNANVTCLQGKFGDEKRSLSPTFAASNTGYRYGFEIVNAGVTVAWTGSASLAASGWYQLATTADVSSKSSLISFNGTSSSRITVTNQGDAYNANQIWQLYSAYGGWTGGYVDFKYSLGNASHGLFINTPASTSRTTLTQIRLHHCTFLACSLTSNGIVQSFPVTPDLHVIFESCTFYAGYPGGGVLSPYVFEYSLPASAGAAFRLPNCSFLLAAGGGLSTVYPFYSVAQPTYYGPDGLYADNVLFSEATPADLVLADNENGGTLRATISNIASYANNDLIVFYNSSNAEIGRITKAAYVAALYEKAANCALLTGLANGTAYTGVYCKATRDNILFSAASGTASGTPTNANAEAHTDDEVLETAAVDPGNVHLPTASQVGEGVMFGPNAATEGTLPVKDLTFAEEAERNTVPDLTKVPTEATGGPAAWLQLNVSRAGSLDLDAAKLAFEAARNNANGTVAADIIAPASVKIRNVTITGTGSAATPPGKPSWGSPAVTPGNGQAVLAVDAAAPADVVYARFQRMLPGQSWSALNEVFKRTGDGNITLTGLTNLLGYVGILHAKSGSLVSEFTGPQYFIPTDGSAAEIKLLMAAIAAQIDLLGLASVKEDGSAVAVTTEVVDPLPPLLTGDQVKADTAVVKIFPDTEDAEALRAKNSIAPRVILAFCQHSKTPAQQAAQMLIRQTLRDEFLGKRVLAYPAAVCVAVDSESGIMDMGVLADEFKWISALTLEFRGLKAR